MRGRPKRTRHASGDPRSLEGGGQRSTRRCRRRAWGRRKTSLKASRRRLTPTANIRKPRPGAYMSLVNLPQPRSERSAGRSRVCRSSKRSGGLLPGKSRRPRPARGASVRFSKRAGELSSASTSRSGGAHSASAALSTVATGSASLLLASTAVTACTPPACPARRVTVSGASSSHETPAGEPVRGGGSR